MKKIVSLLCMFLGALSVVAQPLQRVAPEQVGMDSRRLMYADEVIEAAIANKDIPGAVLAIVRDGKMAYLKAYGKALAAMRFGFEVSISVSAPHPRACSMASSTSMRPNPCPRYALSTTTSSIQALQPVGL